MRTSWVSQNLRGKNASRTRSLGACERVARGGQDPGDRPATLSCKFDGSWNCHCDSALISTRFQAQTRFSPTSIFQDLRTRVTSVWITLALPCIQRSFPHSTPAQWSLPFQSLRRLLLLSSHIPRASLMASILQEDLPIPPDPVATDAPAYFRPNCRQIVLFWARKQQPRIFL